MSENACTIHGRHWEPGCEECDAKCPESQRLSSDRELRQLRQESGELRDGIERAVEDINTLKTELLCLCEKMEAGISGEEETKRARALLEKLA